MSESETQSINIKCGELWKGNNCLGEISGPASVRLRAKNTFCLWRELIQLDASLTLTR